MTARQYIRVPDVAERYGYSAAHVYELAEKGKLPHRKRPGSKALLFLPAELDAADDGALLEVKRLARGGRVVRPKAVAG
jgi:predicted DNA-binding transcriptional regulator AlpA